MGQMGDHILVFFNQLTKQFHSCPSMVSPSTPQSQAPQGGASWGITSSSLHMGGLVDVAHHIWTHVKMAATCWHIAPLPGSTSKTKMALPHTPMVLCVGPGGA